MQTARLDNWSVVYGDSTPYTAPEAMTKRLIGKVSGHPKKEDGKTIITSVLKSISYSKRLAVTEHTTYELGEPDVEFLQFLKNSGATVEQYEFEGNNENPPN